MSEANTKVTIKNCRFSFVHLKEKTAYREGQTPKFSVSILIPKSAEKEIAKIKAAINAAAIAGKPMWGNTIPKNLTNPLHDGDIEKAEYEEYQGHYYLSAKSLNKVPVVDRNRQEILDLDDFYSGCYGNAAVNFYPYQDRGVAVGLNAVQKVKDGEPLSGSKVVIDEVFDVLGDDPEEESAPFGNML